MDPPFPYVYVVERGAAHEARELTRSEREYLTREFAADDGRRPYVKRSFEAADARGHTSGFLPRDLIPAGVAVRPLKEKYDSFLRPHLRFQTHAVRTDPRFPYVYVNLDGSARELSPGEREYLQTEFAPGDGARPYIKDSYGSRTPYGFQSGFMHRALLPESAEVRRVNPRYDEIEREHYVHPAVLMEREAREVGDVVAKNEDGTVTISPNPDVLPEKRMERYRRQRLESNLRRETWARHPEDESE